jgi:hypothetical protein
MDLSCWNADLKVGKYEDVFLTSGTNFVLEGTDYLWEWIVLLFCQCTYLEDTLSFFTYISRTSSIRSKLFVLLCITEHLASSTLFGSACIGTAQ